MTYDRRPNRCAIDVVTRMGVGDEGSRRRRRVAPFIAGSGQHGLRERGGGRDGDDHFRHISGPHGLILSQYGPSVPYRRAVS
jgi:hypothetical protein